MTAQKLQRLSMLLPLQLARNSVKTLLQLRLIWRLFPMIRLQLPLCFSTETVKNTEFLAPSLTKYAAAATSQSVLIQEIRG